ncbi:MAG TPA: hypothetical protein VI386_33565 [Candidatus Sulfotelmatobacter sp.]
MNTDARCLGKLCPALRVNVSDPGYQFFDEDVSQDLTAETATKALRDMKAAMLGKSI